MPRQLSSALSRMGSTIREFTVAQRTFALIGLAALVLAIVALSSWFSRPSYSPLYTGLAAKDASAIVEVLDSSGVSYELTEGGSTVLVPREDVYPMRLATASAGLPTASESGYSLLDQMGMSSSEFQQDTTYKRAMEGELARTIGAMKGVQTASVQLALPEQTVFVAEKADPTASVFVDVAAGAGLSDDQVQAITHLVSASIEGMASTDVAVIDSSGTVLSAVGTGVSASGGNKQTREYEDRVAQSVQSMLDRVVGVGNAVVSVTADLDFDERQSTSQSFSAAEDLPPVSSTETLEEYTGSGAGSTGVLGPDNIAVPDGSTGDGEYRNESSTVNNAIDQVTEVLTSAPGTVRRQSVAVALDQQYAGALNMTDVQSMVVAAAGIDEERGDVVTVSRMTFDSSAAEAAQEALAAARAEAEAEQTAVLVRTAAVTAAALVLLVVTAVIVARGRRSRRLERMALDIGSLNAIEPPGTAAALDRVEEAEQTLALEPADEVLDPATAEADRQRADVAAFAQDDPEQMAKMLRGWIEPGVRA